MCETWLARFTTHENKSEKQKNPETVSGLRVGIVAGILHILAART